MHICFVQYLTIRNRLLHYMHQCTVDTMTCRLTVHFSVQHKSAMSHQAPHDNVVTCLSQFQDCCLLTCFCIAVYDCVPMHPWTGQQHGFLGGWVIYFKPSGELQYSSLPRFADCECPSLSLSRFSIYSFVPAIVAIDQPDCQSQLLNC